MQQVANQPEPSSDNDFFIAPDDEAQLRKWDHPDSMLNRCALNSNQADPFSCLTYWNMAFQEAFSPNRRLLLRATSDSALAFAEKVYPDRTAVLTPIEEHWLYGNPLLGGNPVELFSDLLDDLEAYYSDRFPHIYLSGLKQGDNLKNELGRLLQDRYDIFIHKRERLCSASLTNGFEGFLSRRSTKQRRSLKKQYKRALKEGIYFERVVPESPEEVERTYIRMLNIEEASWKGVGRCGMAESPSREFYQCMLHRLALSRSGRVIFAKHGEEDIGFIFGGLANNHYRGQQFSFSREWFKFSVGNLMQMEQIKWLEEQQITHYDLGPMMSYKKHWTEQQTWIQTWKITQI